MANFQDESIFGFADQAITAGAVIGRNPATAPMPIANKSV